MTHPLEMILFNCVVSKKVKVARRLQEKVEDEFILILWQFSVLLVRINIFSIYFGNMYSNQIFYNKKVLCSIKAIEIIVRFICSTA